MVASARQVDRFTDKPHRHVAQQHMDAARVATAGRDMVRARSLPLSSAASDNGLAEQVSFYAGALPFGYAPYGRITVVQYGGRSPM